MSVEHGSVPQEEKKVDAAYVSEVLERYTKRHSERQLYYRYRNRYDHSKPFGPDNVGAYEWQIEIHNAGAEYTERLLMAANRVGKTECAAAETACHALGRYPQWWEGRIFKEPTRIWIGSESWTASRDIVQEALLGPIGEFGTGWIPKEDLLDWKNRQAGISDLVDTVYVRHSTGGTSIITFKSYEQQRKEWQGKRLHFVWFDEEPPMDIYTEGMTRVLDKKGVVLLTFTPLKGPSEVVRHFLNPKPPHKPFVKNVSWNDAPHLDEKAKAELASSYPEHERETRTKGMPLLGAGAVFPIMDEDIACEPFTIPDHFWRINGIDFGIAHPAAGAFCALDKDSETFYVYDCYKRPGETAVYHAHAMRRYGDWIPNAWPHDGLQRDKGSGIALKDMYRKHGLYMLKEHAHYPDETRGMSREAGLIEMYEWMRTGRFKVFRTLSNWFEEKRLYHRDENGKIVEEYDDIMSATRYAFVMRRYARFKPRMEPISRAPTRPIVGGRI